MLETLDTTIDTTIGGEPVTLAVLINYEYQDGVYHIDPQRCIDSELDVLSVSVEFADNRWATVQDEYRGSLISQVKDELYRHAKSAWDKHIEEREIARHESVMEYRRYG